MTVDFKALLSTNADKDVRPPAFPAGTYEGMITTHAFGESAQKKTPFVKYNIQLSAAGADVDQDELNGLDISKKKLSKDYYITDDAFYRLKELAVSCNIKVNGRSRGEIVEDIQNVPVLVELIQKRSDDGKDTYNEVRDIRGA